LLIAKNCINQPLHDHHLGYITKNRKKRGKKKAPSWDFFFPFFFPQFCDIEMANFPSKIQNQANLQWENRNFAKKKKQF
jgi:hypothetical protein